MHVFLLDVLIAGLEERSEAEASSHLHRLWGPVLGHAHLPGLDRQASTSALCKEIGPSLSCCGQGHSLEHTQRPWVSRDEVHCGHPSPAPFNEGSTRAL